MALQDHVVVMVTPAWRMLEKKVLAMPGLSKIKQDKQNAFFWVDNQLSGAENAAKVKADLTKAAGNAIVFQIYPVFNGHVDMDKTGASPEKKMTMPIFTSGKQDVTDDELSKYAAAHNLAV